MPARWAWSSSRMRRAAARSSRSGDSRDHGARRATRGRCGPPGPRTVGVHALEAAELARSLLPGLVGSAASSIFSRSSATSQVRGSTSRARSGWRGAARAGSARAGRGRAPPSPGIGSPPARSRLELAAEQRVDAPEPREGIAALEHLLRLREPEPQVRRHEVREPPGSCTFAVIESTSGGEVLQAAAGSSTRSRTLRITASISTTTPARAPPAARHAAPERGLVLGRTTRGAPSRAPGAAPSPAVGQAAACASPWRNGPDPVEVVGPRLLELRVPLRGEEQQPVRGQRVLDGRDRRLPRQEERAAPCTGTHELAQAAAPGARSGISKSAVVLTPCASDPPGGGP